MRNAVAVAEHPNRARLWDSVPAIVIVATLPFFNAGCDSPNCPEIASSCDDGCKAFETVSYDPKKKCRMYGVVGCQRPSEADEDLSTGSCGIRSDGILIVTSGGAMSQLKYPACTDAQTTEAAQAPICGGTP